MGQMGLQGAVRGRRTRTTVRKDTDPRPLDLVNRDFRAGRPNQLWVADLTYVPISTGFAYVALITEAFSRRIVGWRVSDLSGATWLLMLSWQDSTNGASGELGAVQ